KNMGRVYTGIYKIPVFKNGIWALSRTNVKKVGDRRRIRRTRNTGRKGDPVGKRHGDARRGCDVTGDVQGIGRREGNREVAVLGIRPPSVAEGLNRFRVSKLFAGETIHKSPTP